MTNSAVGLDIQICFDFTLQYSRKPTLDRKCGIQFSGLKFFCSALPTDGETARKLLNWALDIFVCVQKQHPSSTEYEGVIMNCKVKSLRHAAVHQFSYPPQCVRFDMWSRVPSPSCVVATAARRLLFPSMNWWFGTMHINHSRITRFYAPVCGMHPYWRRSMIDLLLSQWVLYDERRILDRVSAVIWANDKHPLYIHFRLLVRMVVYYCFDGWRACMAQVADLFIIDELHERNCVNVFLIEMSR